MKIGKKFYVGAEHIALELLHSNGKAAEWAHGTLNGAIEHAKSILESEDREMAIIVKIVKVVRKQKVPVIVENVE